MAACALQLRCSSCSVMCCLVSLHSSCSSRLRLVRYCISHTIVRMHTHRETHTPMYMRTCTPFAVSCRNRMFYKNPREEGGRHMTSPDIPISVIKDTTALKVSRWAVYTHQIKSPNFASNVPKRRHIVHLFVLRNAFLLYTLLIINNLLNSRQSTVQ